MKKLNYKYVKEYFKEKNCELLEKEYSGSKIKMKYVCSCGNESEINWTEFKNGTRCMKCKGNQKLDYDFVKKYFEEYGCKLLEDEYKNSKTKMRYICSCRNESEINWSNFKTGYRCKLCGHKKTGKARRLNPNYVKKYFKDNGCKLLDDYANAHIKMKYICECGEESKIAWAHFFNGGRCRKCLSVKLRNLFQFDYDYVVSLFEKHNFQLLENEYVNSRTLMEFICDCGNIGKISLDGLRAGSKCLKCTDHKKWTGRYSDACREWTQKVYKKDNWCCQICFEKSRVLNAHHLYGYTDFPEFKFNVDNGITLCKPCHILFHKTYGNRNNTKEQFEEFKLNTINH